LFFNTTSNSLKVYTGSAWVDGVTTTGDFALKTGNTFTGSNNHNDNVKSIYGTGSDLEIFHNGTNSIIRDVGQGNLELHGENVAIRNANGGEVLAGFTVNGSVQLYYDNNKKLETSSTGIDVTGNITVSGNVDGRDVAADGTALDGFKVGDVTTTTTNGNIKLTPNGTGVVEVKGAGGADGTLQLNCSANSHGIKLKSPPHSAAQSYTLTFPSNIVNGQFLKTDSSGNLSWASADVVDDTTPQLGGNLDLNSNAIEGTGSISISGNISAGTANFLLNDGGRIRLGSAQDIELFHDGSNSYLRETGTGSLFIEGNSNIYIGKASGGAENGIVVKPDNSVDLYYDNSKKFETTSAGVSISGNTTGTGDFETTGANKHFKSHSSSSGKWVRMYAAGGTGQWDIYGNGANLRFSDNAGAGSVVFDRNVDANGGLDVLGSTTFDAGNVTNALHIQATGSYNLYSYHDSGGVGWATGSGGSFGELLYLDDAGSTARLYTGGSERLRADGSGVLVTGNIRAGDNYQLQLGGNGDLRLFHDGSSSYVRNTLANNTLFLQSAGNVVIENTNGSNYFKGVPSGAATLYHNGNAKIETTGSGIQVTGSVGIGTTSPQGNLDLGSATNGRGIVWGGTNGQGHYQSIYTEYSSGSLVLGAGVKGSTSSAAFLAPFTGTLATSVIELDTFGSDGIKFYTDGNSSKTAGNTITPTQRFQINANGDLRVPDGGYLYFGGGNDLGLRSDGSTSFIHSNDLRIRSWTGGENYITCAVNGAVNLYYDNSKKFETTSAGATVTGALTATSFSGDGSNLTGTGGAEIYGFNTDANGNLIVTTTNGGADNISGTTFDSFEDVVFASTGFSFSVNASGNLIATI